MKSIALFTAFFSPLVSTTPVFAAPAKTLFQKIRKFLPTPLETLSVAEQDALLLRGIFEHSMQKTALIQFAETSARHPHWWVWFPETMACIQKKAEKSSLKVLSFFKGVDTQIILSFFQQHPPKTLKGWQIYGKMASHHAKTQNIYHSALVEFFRKASLSEFKDIYPSILKMIPSIMVSLNVWPMHRLILNGGQKPISDARSMLDVIRPSGGKLKLLQRLLARKPDDKIFSDYENFRKSKDWDPLLAVAMTQCFMRTSQGEAAYAERFRNVSKAYERQYPKEITQLDLRIMRQLMQEGQEAETTGNRVLAQKLYQKAVSIPIFAEINKSHDVQWTKGLVYFSGLKNYAQALEHFTKSSSVFSATLLNPNNILKSGSLLAKAAENGVARHDVRALFWLAVCCQYLKKPDLAKAYYEHAAHYGTYFYGQLACWKLNRPVLLNFANPVPGQKDWSAEGQKEALSIITLWKKMATSSKIVSKATPAAGLPAYATTLALCKDLVCLAKTPGDHAMALRLIKLLHPKHVVESAKGMAQNSSHVFKALYPILPYIRCADPALIHGIILTESCFHPTVISWDGGIGIMQIMPETAKKAARDMKIVLNMNRLVRDPGYQITIGSHIISDYLKQVGLLYPPGIAAYNAGVHRARPWVARTPALNIPEDAIIWIESIPFSITHHYVLRVMESYIIYRHLMGKPLNNAEWLKLLRAHV